jgi:hypothetical protein
MSHGKVLKMPHRDMDTVGLVRATGRLARSMAGACPFSKDADWFWRLAEQQIKDYCSGAARFAQNGQIRRAAA